jgi:hypothetical protein
MNARVLTIRQPWASLIALGHKTIETRSWSTPYRGPVLIHAAKRFTWETRGHVRMFNRYLEERGKTSLPPANALPLGKVIARVILDRCVRTSDHAFPPDEYEFGNLAEGRYAWMLTDVVPVVPVPFAGSQGFPAFPDDIIITDLEFRTK